MLSVIFLVLFTVTWAWDPMQNPDLFQGDIAGISSIEDRNAVPSDSQRWPNGVIPYTMDQEAAKIKLPILLAMEKISSKTCIKFKERTNEEDYVNIFRGEGCYSFWGRTGGAQPLSLGGMCQMIGVIVHELMHAIGFDHEHNRSDRDQYLSIKWENIIEGVEDQFMKLKPVDERLYTDFDYNSIMIYDEKSASKNGKDTMVPLQKGVKLQHPLWKDGLSKSDEIRINKLYQCK